MPSPESLAHLPAHFVDSQWIIGSGAAFDVINPANGNVIWRGRAAADHEVERACASARDAFDGWCATPLAQRIAVCERFATLLNANADVLAQTITQEVGKPLWEARGEVGSMAGKVAISVAAQAARAGQSHLAHADGASVLRHRPHGVLGVVGPYNFPGHLPNGHIVPALLAGNTAVFKPSEHAPQTAVATVQLWTEAGLPPGVLNLVNGGRDTGMALVAQPQLDGLLFTGSYRTGAMLHRQFAGRPEKLLALEMGGNNALVIWQPTNLDAAVHHAIFSAFISAGQRCTCARRIIVEEGRRGDAFVARLVEVAARLEVGAGDQLPQPFMGPVVTAAAARQLLAVQDELAARGGTVLLAMRQLVPGTGLLSAGIVDVTHAHDVRDEEWFGPLAQIIRVPSFAAAIKAVNATAYGLAAGLLGGDEQLWQQFREQVCAGVVNRNRPTTGAASSAPFGGIGQSGNHRPSAYYAADYCAYPVASIESGTLELPARLSPGMRFDP